MIEALAGALGGAMGLGELGTSALSAGMMAGSAGASQMFDGLNSAITGDFFGKRARRDSAKVSYNQYLKQMAADYAYANGKGFELAQKYNNANFNLARRYSENSAKWARTGLEKAGLNPLLAASQGFTANMGQQGSVPVSSGASMSSYGSSNPSIGSNLAGTIHQLGSLDVQTSTASKLKADTNVAQAEADYIKANTARVNAETAETLTREQNERKNLGFSGLAAPIGRAVGEVGSALGVGAAKALEDGTFDKIVDFMNKFSPTYWVNRVYGGTSGVQDGHNAKTVRPSVHDISNAKALSDSLSPSPYPVIRTDRRGNPVQRLPRYNPSQESYKEKRERLKRERRLH